MFPSATSDRLSPSPRTEPAPRADELEALRELILGREKQQLQGLRQRIENPGARADDVSRVLPQAVALASARGDSLATALTPSVESALKASVRRDPSPLINALFPVLGPAIRKAIADTFSRLVESLNQALDHSLSVRGLQWRLEALRTGRSFAEVVLVHTLIFRVEQVLLIHPHTGLLLLHVRAPRSQVEDAGMVSGLLTAIQDFARDSFHVPAGETLQALQVGELTVWVEASPQLTLAAVIRGQAPREFRATLQSALETIHREQAPALEAFEGDPAPFELARPHLESCLQARFTGPARRKFPARLVLGLGVIVLLLALWTAFDVRARRRWAGYLERLKAEPGIVVIDAGRHSGRYFVAGLRDPLAADPAAFLPEFRIPPDRVVSRWEPYQALNPPLVLMRARRLLQPPDGVTLRAEDSVLIAAGTAPADWINAAREHAVLLPGIQAMDVTQLTSPPKPSPPRGPETIEQTTVFFDDGVSLAPGQEGVVAALAARLVEWGADAARRGRRFRVSVIGHTDRTGPEEYNQLLSQERADRVAERLTAQGVPAEWLATVGVADREPRRVEAAEEDESRNRRVTFRIVSDRSSEEAATP